MWQTSSVIEMDIGADQNNSGPNIDIDNHEISEPNNSNDFKGAKQSLTSLAIPTSPTKRIQSHRRRVGKKYVSVLYAHTKKDKLVTATDQTDIVNVWPCSLFGMIWDKEIALFNLSLTFHRV